MLYKYNQARSSFPFESTPTRALHVKAASPHAEWGLRCSRPTLTTLEHVYAGQCPHNRRDVARVVGGLMDAGSTSLLLQGS